MNKLQALLLALKAPNGVRLALAGVALGMLLGGASGWAVRGWITAIAEGRAARLAATEQATERDRHNAASAGYAADRAQITAYSWEHINAFVALLNQGGDWTGCDIGADGLRLWNAPVSPRAAAAGADGAVPGFTPSDRIHAADALGEP